jgi:endonuclease/exonuclease/phosphatase (EEP) superfamily protein YafD
MPLRALLHREAGDGQPPLRVVTWNTDGAVLTPDSLRAYLNRWDAQLVLLQDCRGGALQAVRQGDPQLAAYADGEFCLISRLPGGRLEAVRTGRRSEGRGVGFDVMWAGRTLRVVSVHLPSPRDELGAARHGDPSKLEFSVAQRAAASLRLSEWSLAGARHADALIVAGDFNLPYGSRTLRRDWSTLRNAFVDAGWGIGHTMFAGRHRVRIDHVLASPSLVARSARVLRGYPAEHQPVVVEYGWGATP